MRHLVAITDGFGAKLVINPVKVEGQLERCFDYHTRFFYKSRYIFAFRDPVATAISARDLQVLGSGASDSLKVILRNFVEVIGLYLRALRLLPNVRAVFHDGADQEVFADLAE